MKGLREGEGGGVSEPQMISGCTAMQGTGEAGWRVIIEHELGGETK